MRYTLIFLLVLNSSLAQDIKSINTGFGTSSRVEFSPIRNQLAIAVGNSVKVYQSGILIRQFKKHRSPLVDLHFNMDGEKLLTVTNSGYVNVWEDHNEPIVDLRIDRSKILGARWLKGMDRFVVVTASSLHLYRSNGNLVKETSFSTKMKVMTVSENGEFIVLSGHSGQIHIYTSSGDKLIDWNSEQGAITAFVFDPKTSLMASAGKGGGIKLWSVDQWSNIRVLLANKRGFNAMRFSNGSKFLTVGGDELIFIPIDEEQPMVAYGSQSSEIIDISFNPNGDQIAVITDLSPQALMYDIKDLGIPPMFRFKDEGDNIAPQIYISNPPKIVNSRINITKDIIDIQGSIFDDYGVKSLRINGIETAIRENGKFIIHMPLAMGENEIVLEANDINGNTSLKKFIINRRDRIDSYDPKLATNYLFVVGIDNYEHWPMLNNAVKDANDLSTLLLNEYQFSFSSITVLKNEQATEENILNGLRSLIEKISPQDNLIIYFSGHGYYDELLNEGYWIPVKGRPNHTSGYLSNSSIIKIIENINAQHTFLIADACFSGSLFTDPSRGGYIDKVEKFKSRWGLASGRLEAVSDGPSGSNSPFARVLINYLKNIEKNEFAVSELIQHVKIEVSEETGQTPIGNPLRISGDEGGEFIFRRRNKLPQPNH